MNLYPKNKKTLLEVKKFIVIFYIVGIIGFIIPYSRDIFIAITPFALLISTYLLGIYHNNYNLKTISVFILVYLTGFFIEVAGVNTGIIFGEYTYGSAMGIKIFGTPLLIGINWLFLTYTAISVSEQLKINRMFIPFFAPLLMLIYDMVIEQLASKMDMWYWQGNVIPLQNYIAWYLIAVCFAFLFKWFKVNTKNSLSSILLISQFIFFVVLMFYFKIKI